MWAKIENNIVVNIIEATNEFISALDGNYVFSEDAKVGYGYDSDSGTFYSLNAPFNGAEFDSETFTWYYPTSPGSGYYWSDFSGAWIVDNRPAPPYDSNRPNAYVWFEEADSIDGQWVLNIDSYVSNRIRTDKRKENLQKFYKDTNTEYLNKLRLNWESGYIDSDLITLRNVRILIDSYSDSDWLSSQDIIVSALDSDWTI